MNFLNLNDVHVTSPPPSCVVYNKIFTVFGLSLPGVRFDLKKKNKKQKMFHSE